MATGMDQFSQAFNVGSQFGQNQQEMEQRIQNAYIQREANARANAKQQHDFAVDSLENRMKLLGSGAAPVGSDGTIQQSIAGNLGGSAPMNPDLGQGQPFTTAAPDTGGINGVPAATGPLGSMGIADKVIQAGSQYNGTMQTPADPNLTVTAPDGSKYQLPSIAQRNQMADAANTRAAGAAGQLEEAKAVGKGKGEAEDLAANGRLVPDGLAAYLGLEKGARVKQADLQKMIVDVSTRKHNEAMEAVAAAKQLDDERRIEETERHNRASEDTASRRADQTDARLDRMGGDKPVTKQQLIGIETRKQAGLAAAQTAFAKAVKAATMGGKIDPDAFKEAKSDLDEAKQRVQNGYESELQTAGVGADHFEYGRSPAPAPATPAPAAKPATPAPAAPAAAATKAPSLKTPSPQSGPPPEAIAKMKLGVNTLRNGEKWRKNADGTVSKVRGT